MAGRAAVGEVEQKETVQSAAMEARAGMVVTEREEAGRAVQAVEAATMAGVAAQSAAVDPAAGPAGGSVGGGAEAMVKEALEGVKGVYLPKERAVTEKVAAVVKVEMPTAAGTSARVGAMARGVEARAWGVGARAWGVAARARLVVARTRRDAVAGVATSELADAESGEAVEAVEASRAAEAAAAAAAEAAAAMVAARAVERVAAAATAAAVMTHQPEVVHKAAPSP